MSSLKYIIIALLFWAMPYLSMAQQARMANNNQGGGNRINQSNSTSNDDEDPCIEIDDHRFCWTMDPITGIQHIQVPDTAYEGLAHRQTMMGKSLGLLYTGNLFSPHLIQNVLDRRQEHDFMFVNAYSLFAFRPEDMVYYNTRMPYTSAQYYTSGSSLQSNDHLKLGFAGNVDSRIGVGTYLDYVYARGEYSSQATKPLNWNSYLYFMDDQYKATLTYNLAKLANQENGGIEDRDCVLRPDSMKAIDTDPRTMAVNLDKTWNDMDSYNLHFNHSYDLGFWRDESAPDDTLANEKFVSVASIFHSMDLQNYDHKFRMDRGAMDIHHPFYTRRNYISKFDVPEDATIDSTAYMSFSTYAGIRLNEGFNKWSQFGLSAFVGYEYQRYTMMQDSLNLDFVDRQHTSHNVFVGGQLSRHLDNRLTFDVTAKLGLTGDKQGDFDVTGTLQTVIPAGKDSITFSGLGSIRNTQPSYLLNHYYSRHYSWDKNFDKQRQVKLEGRLRYSLTGTEARIGVQNLSNYIYFSQADSVPMQTEKEIQVISAEIGQKLHWRGLHFDNRVLLQKSSHQELLPLPELVWQSDLNLQFCIAGALTTQLGVTGVYTSKYYAPNYQPAVQQFAVQDEIECGGYPTFNIYVNCNLKKIKFYIMYSGLTAFTNDTFLMPYYPMQSTRVEYGVSFDLQN